MTPKSAEGRAWFSAVAFLCVVALVVVAGLAFVISRPAGTKYAAMLSTVIGLYPGSDVRVLGVPVGSVDSITPQGALVRVDFHVNSDIKVPAGALAAVVAPTVVADRYLQLAPAYTGGPTMPPGTVIPNARTASPAEFDDLLASVQKLSTSLGPQGVNSQGALSDALHTLAQNLNGNGQQINTTLSNASQAVTTLSANQQNLAGTIRNLQSFTTNLKGDDTKVRAFTQQFAQVSGYLSDERQDLGETLRELSETLGEVAKFVRDNRSEIRTNVDRLSDILGTVNDQRLSLEQLLDTAPSGLDGLVNSYNASSATIDTRANILPSVLCSVYNVLPDSLKLVMGPLLQSLVPGGVNGCVNGSGLKLPALPSSALAQLKVPGLPSARAVAPALTALPSLPTAPTPSDASDARGEHQQPRNTPQPKRPSTLTNLLGGG